MGDEETTFATQTTRQETTLAAFYDIEIVTPAELTEVKRKRRRSA